MTTSITVDAGDTLDTSHPRSHAYAGFNDGPSPDQAHVLLYASKPVGMPNQIVRR